jgi:hypothetical protein
VVTKLVTGAATSSVTLKYNVNVIAISDFLCQAIFRIDLLPVNLHLNMLVQTVVHPKKERVFYRRIEGDKVVETPPHGLTIHLDGLLALRKTNQIP